MLLYAFPSMSVRSLREFPENCVYRHGGFNCFIKYLHRKLLITNFSLMILKVFKNVHLLDLYIKTIIFLFSIYIHVFNLYTDQLLPLLKYMLTWIIQKNTNTCRLRNVFFVISSILVHLQLLVELTANFAANNIHTMTT
jgi:hypothetical protein